MAPPFAEFDLTDWPLALVIYRGMADDASFEAYLDRLLQTYQRGERFALVLDSTQSGVLPSSLRRRQAEWIKEHAELVSRRCAGIAFVIDSPLHRGVLSAILWFYPIPTVSTVVSTRTAAMAWARARLRDRDVA